MDRKIKVKSVGWKTYTIPLVIIVFLCVLATYFITNSIKVSLFKHMVEDSIRQADNQMSRLSNSISATKMIEKLLNEKLIVANNSILKNRDRLSNEFLKEKIDELKVDEIYWYNSNGEIIFTGGEYLGWRAIEEHPVHEFMKSNEDIIIGDIRKDTESDKYYKYTYAKTGDGEFVQIGILADNIYELTSKFCPQHFVDELVKKDDIKGVQLRDLRKQVNF